MERRSTRGACPRRRLSLSLSLCASLIMSGSFTRQHTQIRAHAWRRCPRYPDTTPRSPDTPRGQRSELLSALAW
eukprot:2368072-Rhodomonas_salina.2